MIEKVALNRCRELSTGCYESSEIFPSGRPARSMTFLPFFDFLRIHQDLERENGDMGANRNNFNGPERSDCRQAT